jgi:hypothetical protein
VKLAILTQSEVVQNVGHRNILKGRHFAQLQELEESKEGPLAINMSLLAELAVFENGRLNPIPKSGAQLGLKPPLPMGAR